MDTQYKEHMFRLYFETPWANRKDWCPSIRDNYLLCSDCPNRAIFFCLNIAYSKRKVSYYIYEILYKCRNHLLSVHDKNDTELQEHASKFWTKSFFFIEHMVDSFLYRNLEGITLDNALILLYHAYRLQPFDDPTCNRFAHGSTFKENYTILEELLRIRKLNFEILLKVTETPRESL
jgi:hypothetical protein